MSFVEFHDVKKIYHMGEVEIPALQGVNFESEKGEFCVIVGASGAGKTTILNILGGIAAVVTDCTSLVSAIAYSLYAIPSLSRAASNSWI